MIAYGFFRHRVSIGVVEPVSEGVSRNIVAVIRQGEIGRDICLPHIPPVGAPEVGIELVVEIGVITPAPSVSNFFRLMKNGQAFMKSKRGKGVKGAGHVGRKIADQVGEIEHLFTLLLLHVEVSSMDEFVRQHCFKPVSGLRV